MLNRNAVERLNQELEESYIALRFYEDSQLFEGKDEFLVMDIHLLRGQIQGMIIAMKITGILAEDVSLRFSSQHQFSFISGSDCKPIFYNVLGTKYRFIRYYESLLGQIDNLHPVSLKPILLSL